MQSATVRKLARECGFELAGVARAEPLAEDFARYQSWVSEGMAGKMGYLTDRRAELRRDPRNLLASAKSILCVGKLYHQAQPEPAGEGHARIAQYARGADYHDSMREGLEKLAHALCAIEPFEWRACVDTAPLLE